jgi:3-oxoacyl-[acyl-carrier-protein] synthase II
MATTFGCASSTEALLLETRAAGPEAASPFQFTACVANAPAAQIALSLEARGANFTLMQGEAGPLLALARAAREVSAGRAELALAGAVDEVTPLMHAILGRFGALARPDESGAERSLPFAADRDGYTVGEGASVMVLEPEAAARARGARILARVGASAGANDPSAPAAGWGSGAAGLAAALQRLLGADQAPIDRIVSGASGSRRGDLLEARVLKAAFEGGSLPPVHTPKGIVGEHGGGFLAAAVLAATGSPIARPRGCDAVDPEIDFLAHAGRLPDPPARTLVTALACGGPAAWLLLERA